MRSPPLIPLLAAALLVMGATFPEANYDAPMDMAGVDLGPSRTASEQNNAVRCHTYRGMMVKEVDLREVGDEQISLIPVGPRAFPPCQRAALPGERIVSPEVWRGYFAGMFSRFAVLRAADGSNGGIEFAVWPVTLQAPVYVSTASGPLRFDFGAAGRVVLRFDRLYLADCSVPAGGAACAQAIARETAAQAVAVDLCLLGYEAARRMQARRYCEAEDDASDACFQKAMRNLPALTKVPSVIAIPTDVTLQGLSSREQVVAAPRACWPQD